MSISNFLSPKLMGERFKGHSIPLELLGDLAVLEPMVIEVAKWRYLKENPGRKRSLRHFTEGISLNLTSVEDGSAIPVIALLLGMSDLLPPFQQVYLEQARDAIVNAIGAAADNQSPTPHLPLKSLAYFNRLGRSLLDDEAIEFPTKTGSPPARLTKETRRRLLRAAEITERSEEIHLRGGIYELNQVKSTFEMMLPDGGKVSGPAVRQHFDTILEAFNGHRQGVKVLLDGVGQFDRSERLQKIESIDHVTLLDPLDFQSQLDELRVLKDGWYDGQGRAPQADGLDWLAKAFNEHYPDHLGLPYLYPVAEGGVRFEWSIERQDVSLEIDLLKRSGDWHSLNLDTNGEEARSLRLDKVDDWTWMSERLQTLSGVGS